jgi:hypothetical protein
MESITLIERSCDFKRLISTVISPPLFEANEKTYNPEATVNALREVV